MMAIRILTLAAFCTVGLYQTVAAQATAAQATTEVQPSSAGKPLRLSVAVNGAAGPLQSGDLTLLDNGTSVPIRDLRPLSAERQPTHVILVLDDVNSPITTIAFERSELKRYLTRNDGQLRHPLALAVMTDTKTDIQNGFSTNGIAQNDALQKVDIGLHTIHRSSQYGGFDRTDIGLRTLAQLLQYTATIPGHKLIVFLSPGWPLLTGPHIDLSRKESERIVAQVAHLQDAMLQSNTTVAMINPIGPAEPLLRSDYYQAFLKGVKDANHADLADLSLQVLATHSGGFVLQGSSDIAGMLDDALRDLDNTYELTFQPAPVAAAGSYHSLKLTTTRTGLSLRAPDEYYSASSPSR